MSDLLLLPLSILPVLVIAAGLHDLTTMKIPNWISGLLFLTYFPTAFMLGLPLATIGLSLALCLLVLVVGAGMFALKWMGGGDAKLIAAATLWMGVAGILPLLLYTALIGGGFCLVLMAARSQLQVFAMNGPGWVTRLMQPKGDLPYGVAIAIGALLAYPYSPLVQAFTSA